MNRPVFFALLAFVLAGSACSSCGSCGDKKTDGPDMAGPIKPKVDPHAPPSMPPPGSDADQKRLEALALATTIDGALTGLAHEEKPAAEGPNGVPRKAEVWYVDGNPKVPKKLILKDLDASGAVQAQTDMYFDDHSMLSYAKAPDGHFVFRMEGLALWLDPEQRIKRGVKPQDANARANELKKAMSAALTSFRIR